MDFIQSSGEKHSRSYTQYPLELHPVPAGVAPSTRRSYTQYHRSYTQYPPGLLVFFIIWGLYVILRALPGRRGDRRREVSKNNRTTNISHCIELVARIQITITK